MKTWQIRHIYECYPLYRLLFGRSRSMKAHDALTAAIAADAWSAEKKVKELRVLELFAGQSEHEEHFRAQFNRPEALKSYTCLDIQVEPGQKGVVQGDALTFDYRDFNFVVAYYYSMAASFIQVMDPYDSTRRPRALLDKFTSQVFRTMPKKSALFLHTGLLNHAGAVTYVEEEREEQFFLEAGHPVARALGFTKPLIVRGSVVKHYDRVSCCTYDKLKPFHVYQVNGRQERKVLEIRVRAPFIQRFWTEPEVVDSLAAAGFSEFKFYNNAFSYADGPYTELQQVVDTPEEDADEVTATEILAIK